MSEKHDRGYARTAQDIENKYRFGKTFAEMLGLINENRDKVDSVESELRDEIKEQSTLLMRDTEQIVMQATETVKRDIDEVGNSVDELTKQVNLKIDASALSVKVKEEVSKGVSLETGYTFDANGLNISKSGESLKNRIDNTGMYVTNSGEDVLVANKDGVEAKDLHASTYLIIGQDNGRSRFEDYDLNGEKRTACFWIGG